MSEAEIKRLNDENKEIRLLVKIGRIKVCNTGTTGNMYCKFTFADLVPFKVVDFLGVLSIDASLDDRRFLLEITV